jgi:hypothetical protein
LRAGPNGLGGKKMKIYVLLSLIALLVCLSHWPIGRKAKKPSAASPDSLPA